MVLTADDGHRTVYSDMFPLIQRLKIPVTLFIYPSAISNADYAMTWAQLAEMKASGLVDIQSSHLLASQFQRREASVSAPAAYEKFTQDQLLKSKAVLEQRFGEKVTSWPGRSASRRSARSVGAGGGLCRGVHDRTPSGDAVRQDHGAAALHRHQPRPRRTLRVASGSIKMKNVLRPLLAAAALFLVPVAAAHAQDTDRGEGCRGEAGPGQGGGARRRAGRHHPRPRDRRSDRRRHRHGGRQDGADRREGPLSRPRRYQPLQVRAVGYGRSAVAASDAGPPTTELAPLRPKALYLTVYGIGAPFLLDPALDVIEKSGLKCAGHRSQRRSRPHPLSQPAAACRQDRGAKTAHHSRPEGARDQSQEQGHLPDCPHRRVQGRPAGRGASAVGDPNRGRRPVEGPRGLAWIDPSRQRGVGLHLERRRGGRRGRLRRDPVRLHPLPRHRRPCLRQCVRRERRVAAITGFLSRGAQAPHAATMCSRQWIPSATSAGTRTTPASARGSKTLPRRSTSSRPCSIRPGFQFGILGYPPPPQSGPKPVRNRPPLAGRM